MGMHEINVELYERTINDILLRLTASTCPVLPRFAIFVTFFAISTKTANLANRAKTRQITAFQEEKLT